MVQHQEMYVVRLYVVDKSKENMIQTQATTSGS